MIEIMTKIAQSRKTACNWLNVIFIGPLLTAVNWFDFPVFCIDIFINNVLNNSSCKKCGKFAVDSFGQVEAFSKVHDNVPVTNNFFAHDVTEIFLTFHVCIYNIDCKTWECNSCIWLEMILKEIIFHLIIQKLRSKNEKKKVQWPRLTE